MEFGCEPVAQSSDHHSSWVRDQFHSLLDIKAALEAGGSNSLELPNNRPDIRLQHQSRGQSHLRLGIICRAI